MNINITKITDLLEKIGFSKLESKIYIIGLTNGPITMSKLARISGTSRQTVYEAVRKLESKDLAITNQKEYGQKVYMANLEKIEQHIERQKKELEFTGKEIQKIANQFQSPDTKLPAVRFFEGITALKKAWYETLDVKNKKVYTLMPITNMTEMLGANFNERYVKDRVAKGIESNSIRLDNPRDDKQNHKGEMRRVRYLSPELYDIPSLFCVFDDKTLIVTSKAEEVGLIIESKEISKSLMNVWKILWKQASEK
jgi:sugar-specific transcriptional regulator TrmB